MKDVANMHTIAGHIREQLENEILATPSKNPTPTTPGPTQGELLQSAPILGIKRSREIEPHVSRDIFAKEIAASFVNRRETQSGNCRTR